MPRLLLIDDDERLGPPLATYFAGPKARWILDNVPGAREQAEDLWALHPWTHPEGKWRRVLGPALDLLIKDRWFSPVQLAFVEHLARELTTPNAVMFLDTHVAPPDEVALAGFGGRVALSPLVTLAHRGHDYAGRWYHEYDGAHAPDEAWTSVSNARSFWPTEPALIAALLRGGWDRVYPIYGTFEIGEEFALRRQYSRAWYVAVKGD